MDYKQKRWDLSFSALLLVLHHSLAKNTLTRDSENVDHRQQYCQSKSRLSHVPFAHVTREKPGDMQTAVSRDWREELCCWLQRKQVMSTKLILKTTGKPSNVEIVVSLRINSISNLSVLLHCFVATEKVRKIILVVIMTPSCLINLILRELLCETEF